MALEKQIAGIIRKLDMDGNKIQYKIGGWKYGELLFIRGSSRN